MLYHFTALNPLLVTKLPSLPWRYDAKEAKAILKLFLHKRDKQLSQQSRDSRSFTCYATAYAAGKKRTTTRCFLYNIVSRALLCKFTCHGLRVLRPLVCWVSCTIADLNNPKVMTTSREWMSNIVLQVALTYVYMQCRDALFGIGMRDPAEEDLAPVDLVE